MDKCSETLKTQILTADCSSYILQTGYETGYKYVFIIFNVFYVLISINWFIAETSDIFKYPEVNSFCYCFFLFLKRKISRMNIMVAPAPISISTISVVISQPSVCGDIESGIMEECIVCYENKKITEFIDITCNHKLCKICNSRLETRKCPMCRRNI